MELIIFSYIIDLVFGDPQWFPHPVRLMGRLISFFDCKLNTKLDNKSMKRFWGAFTTINVVVISGICAYIVIELSKRIHPFVGKICWIFLAYTTLATKDLAVHTQAVLKEIINGNIKEARKKLSFIVGRDTQNLSEEAVVLATLETVAENTNDGIIAPLFYLFLGGPVLAIAYKAINTLDSMIGYKNEKYKDFGWFSAKLDEVANFIPARISGLLIVGSSFILGKNFKSSLITMIKDAKKHPSPNAGFPEAAMAGALGIKLGGPCTYEGKLCIKPYIGEERNPLHPYLINEALTISFVSSILMVSIGLLLKWLI